MASISLMTWTEQCICNSSFSLQSPRNHITAASPPSPLTPLACEDISTVGRDTCYLLSISKHQSYFSKTCKQIQHYVRNCCHQKKIVSVCDKKKPGMHALVQILSTNGVCAYLVGGRTEQGRVLCCGEEEGTVIPVKCGHAGLHPDIRSSS